MAKTATIRARVTEVFKERFAKALAHEGLTESEFIISRAEQFVREVEEKMKQ